MGRGGYNGGSTVVGPGSGWFSYSEPPPPGKKVKGRKGPNLNDLRLGYLSAIIAAELRSEPPPAPPKNARVGLSQATSAAGGPLQWAKAQSEYSVLFAKQQRRFARRASRRKAQSIASFPVTTKPVIRPPSSEASHAKAASIESLRKERARLNTALIEAEKLANSCRRSIAKIDRELASLNAGQK